MEYLPVRAWQRSLRAQTDTAVRAPGAPGREKCQESDTSVSGIDKFFELFAPGNVYLGELTVFEVAVAHPLLRKNPNCNFPDPI